MSTTVSSLSLGRLVMLFLFGVAMLALGAAVARRAPAPVAAVSPAPVSAPPVEAPKPPVAEVEAPIERHVRPVMPVDDVPEVDAGTANAAPAVAPPPVVTPPAPPVPASAKPAPRALKPGILGFAAAGDAVIYLDGQRLGKGFVIAPNLAAGVEHEVRAVSPDGVEVKRRVVVGEGESRLVALSRPGAAEAEVPSVPVIASEPPAAGRRVQLLSVTEETRLVALQSESSGDPAPLAVGRAGTLSDGLGGAPVLVSCERVFGSVSVCRYGAGVLVEGRAWLRVADMK